MTIPPNTCLKTSRLHILQCLLNVLRPLLPSIPHGLEVISTSLLTLNFIHLPESTSPVLNLPRFRTWIKTSYFVFLLGCLTSISNLTWPTKNCFIFIFKSAPSPVFLSHYVLPPNYLVGANQKSWHYLLFVYFITSPLYIQSSRSTSKTYTRPATSFHGHLSPQHLHLLSKLLEEFPG